MKTINYLFTLLFVFSIFACSDDDNDVTSTPLTIGFESASADFNDLASKQNIPLVFSNTTAYEGSVKINIETNIPLSKIKLPYSIENNAFVVPFEKGLQGTSFTLEVDTNNLILNPYLEFKISEINYKGGSVIQGYSSLYYSYDKLTEGTIAPNIGGPNEPNQVYVNIATGKGFEVKRDSWDLGFSNASNHTTLNGSIYMAAKEMEQSFEDLDFSKITEEEYSEIAVGTFVDANKAFINSPDGDLEKTPIEVGATEKEAKTYLVNLGVQIPTEKPKAGSINVSGESRGFAKLKVWKENDKYKIKYQIKGKQEVQENTITPNPEYNFQFINLLENKMTMVEPPKNDWNLCFTVFTNTIEGYGSYGYSDFVYHNRNGNTLAAKVENKEFEDFSIEEAKKLTFSKDLREIGSSWRSVEPGAGPIIFDNVFYILKIDDAFYKIKFLSFLNEDGERGHPKFMFKKL